MKRLTTTQLAKMILLESDYFEKADKHVELSRVFLKDSWWEHLSLWFDMLIYPILSLCYFIYNSEKPSIFTMISMYKCINLWIQWAEYQSLNADIREWMNIVRSIDGPFISTNDPTYHVFVYADGMTRIKNSFTTSPHLRAK